MHVAFLPRLRPLADKPSVAPLAALLTARHRRIIYETRDYAKYRPGGVLCQSSVMAREVRLILQQLLQDKEITTCQQELGRSEDGPDLDELEEGNL